jgi:hypothetical protein
MKTFILFLVLCYIGGLVFWKASARQRSVVLIFAGLLITSVFFFLNRIY